MLKQIYQNLQLSAKTYLSRLKTLHYSSYWDFKVD